VDNALHSEDFELRFSGAANKERLFDGREPMLLIEATRVGGSHDNNWPFVPRLSVLDGQGEQVATQAGSGGLGPDKEKSDLTGTVPKEAKNARALLGDEELTRPDGGMVNFVCSAFEPGVELSWGVRRPAKTQH
jgi:hypothetical protein